MSFSTLPTEAVLQLAECMRDNGVSLLARTCRTLYRLLNPYLYRRDRKRKTSLSLVWALVEMRAATMKQCLDVGVDVNASVGRGGIMRPNQEIRPLLSLVLEQWNDQGARGPAYRHKRPDLDFMSMVRLLLDRGAELLQDDAENLLMIAGRQQLVEWVQFVFERWSYLGKKATDMAQTSRVMEAAARGGSVEVLQLLLDNGYPADNEQPHTLHITALRNNIPAARLLLQGGADVNRRNRFGRTPLHSLLLSKLRPFGDKGPSAMIRLLVEHGADLNDQFDSSSPLLLAAVDCQNDAMLSYMARSGADFVSPDHCGSTLLHKAAAETMAPDVIAKLAELGVNPQAVDFHGNTALHKAAALPPGITKITTELLRLPVNINAMNNEGESALHIASCEAETTKRPKMLVEAGADIDARRTSDGRTALHIAVRCKNNSLVRQLLSLGANASIRDNNGKTPLDVARELKKSKRPTSIENLLRANCEDRGDIPDDTDRGERRSKRLRGEVGGTA